MAAIKITSRTLVRMTTIGLGLTSNKTYLQFHFPHLLHLLRLLCPPRNHFKPKLRPLQLHLACNTLASQYFGLFTNTIIPLVAPLLFVEFDTKVGSELQREEKGFFFK
ncbi:hypothetical protein GBA52_026829 [Prunus armeniaca]|nr:hypothetical protein GBA52_026829 [Prunus armeniaca]